MQYTPFWCSVQAFHQIASVTLQAFSAGALSFSKVPTMIVSGTPRPGHAAQLIWRRLVRNLDSDPSRLVQYQ